MGCVCHCRRKPRRGAILVQMALCLTVVFGILAIVMDGGMMLTERRRAQAAADAAALAAAADLFKNYRTNSGLDSGGSAKTSAWTTAAALGYSKSNVTVNIPPTSGDHVGVAGYAEVTVTSSQTCYFSAIWGVGSPSVSARAVARGQWKTSDSSTSISNIGILVTGSSSSVVSETGAAGLDLPSTATFAVNATSSPFTSKGSKAEITAGGFVFGASKDNLGNPPTLNGPTPTYSTQTADPFSSLAAPTTTGLTAQSYSSGQTTMSPGIYTGVIKIGGSSVVTMSPGIYYLKPDASGDAGLILSGSASLDATGGTLGVLIYVAPPASSGTGTMTISNGGNNNMSINPISVGTYKGISIYVDPQWGNTSGNSNVNLELGGTPDASVYGTIYAPSANLTLHGSPDGNAGSQLIVYSMTIKGKSGVGSGNGPKAGQSSTFQLVE